jgi:hypothetical protein
MRLTTLLLLLFAVLLLTAPASFAQSASSSKALSPFSGDTGAVIRPSAPSFPGDPNSSWAKLNLMDSHPVCYTMRTYLVARDTPGSDSTHVAGYSECLPSWKLEMRTSEYKDPAAQTPKK